MEVIMSKYKRCPFCGAEVDRDVNFIVQLKDGSFAFDHFCKHDENLISVIHLYGDSVEEIIDLWNRRVGDEVETSESL
jgi:hypothetical protein